MEISASQKNDGVSPVIGMIFLIALTIVLIGIVGAAMVNYGIPEPAPILGISIGQQGNIITVTHLNGDVLLAGTYKIFIDSVDKTSEFGGNVDFGPGIILSWNSGTEAVGTVSIVYTSENGFSTLLAEKNIGKAGSTVLNNSVEEKKIVEKFEDTYTIITRVDWQTFLDKVNASISGLSLGHGIVYVDNGEYWVSLDNKRVSKAEAAKNPSIQEYMDIYQDNRLIMIDLSKKMYTESDMDPTDFSQPWKSTPYPTIGSLYEYKGGLYMDAIVISNIIRPSRDPNTADWVKIAYLK